MVNDREDGWRQETVGVSVLILEEIGVTNLEKAEIMAKSFTKIHSSENLSEEERRRRLVTLNQHVQALNWKE